MKNGKKIEYFKNFSFLITNLSKRKSRSLYDHLMKYACLQSLQKA